MTRDYGVMHQRGSGFERPSDVSETGCRYLMGLKRLLPFLEELGWSGIEVHPSFLDSDPSFNSSPDNSSCAIDSAKQQVRDSSLRPDQMAMLFMLQWFLFSYTVCWMHERPQYVCCWGAGGSAGTEQSQPHHCGCSRGQRALATVPKSHVSSVDHVPSTTCFTSVPVHTQALQPHPVLQHRLRDASFSACSTPTM